MVVVEKHIVPTIAEKQRLSDYLVGKLQMISSRKGIKKAIKNNQVLFNGVIGKTGDWVETGAIIELLKPEIPTRKVFKLKIPVLFEDQYLAIVNKPSGYMVNGNQFKTIENALPFNLEPSKEIDVLDYPLVAHRLDAPTSGLLIVAKTRKARASLGQYFEKKLIQKTYQAIVQGQMEQEEGRIDLPIDERLAVTTFKKIQSKEYQNQWLTLIELYPKTGRRHQLRKHLLSLGHPILGDKMYGEINETSKGKGLFLCAKGISFEHPLTKEMLNVEIKSPRKFQVLFNENEG